MYLCICKSVSDQQIRHAVEQGARTVGDLNVQLGIGRDCGRCLDSINEWLDLCLTTQPPVPINSASLPPPVNASSPPVSVAPAPAQAAWFTLDP
ncbi:MAG: (2Fe-2S)-binding protein [Candidatus Competibacteraceae bacterium]|nr:(2Fe-2S)-binding protein [Candidatus Competibacteraceae bacterium]